MNKNLNEAIFDIAKVDAMLFSIEKAYICREDMPGDQKRLDRGTYAFYALWDAVRRVTEDLDRLSGDCRVVDAICAANDVRRQTGTLKTEK